MIDQFRWIKNGNKFYNKTEYTVYTERGEEGKGVERRLSPDNGKNSKSKVNGNRYKSQNKSVS